MRGDTIMEPIFWTRRDAPASRPFLFRMLDIAINERRITTFKLRGARVLGGEVISYRASDPATVKFRIITAGASDQVMTRGIVGIDEVIVTDRLVREVDGDDAETPVPTNLATLIRDTRASRGLTQADLASAASVSQSYIGHLENGRQVPTAPATIQALADALGIDADAIYAAAGRVPDDLARRLASDPDAVRIVRRALGKKRTDTELTL